MSLHRQDLTQTTVSSLLWNVLADRTNRSKRPKEPNPTLRYSPTTSEPRRVPKARQVVNEIFSLIILTEPSIIRAWTIPVWWLRAVSAA